ncbi:unnamed protein product [Vitrella brassicaformis CCMP3155]|uniref:50S ribosomal protein L20 n=1 Tax=Vitrella brassicaformis (strain CCMP3155) TaxID=1169540 RepID=A0A0G4EN02_VITBC|nr:unnamed protein product [Vitrella brassicaformis CCMP3155]|eukprot:CEL99207.1 unnamed protein product [Vitrella brassicaformis CCMP3155]
MISLSPVCLGSGGRIPREVIFQIARGFYGRSKGCLKLAARKVEHALFKSYLARHDRSRLFRRHWISRINSASREYNMPYAWLQCALQRGNIHLDRKTLCTLAETEPVSFKCVVDEAKRLFYVPPSKRRDTSDL